MIRKLAIALFAQTLFCFPSFSQKEELALKEQLWTNASQEFKVTAVPEKWQNESAVILASSYEYVGDFSNRVYVEKLNYHIRIKLLDKAAVNEYSELSFNKNDVHRNMFGKSSSYRIIAAKVVKGNGKEKEVDLKQGVNVDAASSKDYKIAVPDLEPGDILDYFIAVKGEVYPYPFFTEYDIMESKFPQVYKIISYRLPKSIFLHHFAYNGSPGFTIETEKKETIYTLVDKMRDKAPDLMWNYPYRTSPEIRYQVSNERVYTEYSLAVKRALEQFNAVNYSNIGYLEDFMRDNFKKEKNPKVIVNEIYYALRNPIYMKAYYDYDPGDPMATEYVSDLFYGIMSKYLIKAKIKHDIIIAPSRAYGPFDKLMNGTGVSYMMKVYTDPPMYLTSPFPFSIPGEISQYTEGMESMWKRYPVPKNEESSGMTTIETTKAADNSTSTKFEVSINSEDQTKIDIKRSCVSKGHNKRYHQYLIYTNYDYIKEYDKEKYMTVGSVKLAGIVSKYNKEKEKYSQRMTQDYNERDKKLKEEIEEDIVAKVSDYKNLSVKSIGMWDSSPNTEYSDEFTLENISKKVGRNQILELGKLIYKQTEIKDEYRKRTKDVFMNYARSYSDEIVFEIPAGYKVEGIENFNKKIENVTGGLVSTAVIQEGKVVITIKKYFNSNYYPSDKWPLLLQFIDASVEIYNAKLLLKKI